MLDRLRDFINFLSLDVCLDPRSCEKKNIQFLFALRSFTGWLTIGIKCLHFVMVVSVSVTYNSVTYYRYDIAEESLT